MNMDVNSFDEDTLDRLSFARSFASMISNGKVNPSGRLRKKITKNVLGNFSNDIDPSVVSYLKKCDNAQFFEIIEKSFEAAAEKEKEKERAFFGQFPELSEITRSILFELCQGRFDIDFTEVGNDLLISFSDLTPMLSLLTLENFSTEADLNLLFEGGGMSEAKVERSGNGYVLSVWNVESGANDETPTGKIFFQTAKGEFKLYRAFAANFTSAWEYLISRSGALIALSEKVQLKNEEAKLLPLAKELVNLFSDVQEEEIADFSLIKKCAEASGYEKIAKKLEELKTLDGKKLKAKRTLLGVKLQNAQFEGLWRALAQPFLENEKSYPTFGELVHKTGKTLAVRAEIERLMCEKGYGGEYPNFSKAGALSGVYTIADEMYLKKRNAEFFVSFAEYSGTGDEMGIGFLSATRLEPKSRKSKDNSVSDIWSCLFVGNDRCHVDSGAFWSSEDEPDVTAQFGEISQAVDIAVKRAERKRLTKEEKATLSLTSSLDRSFLSMFILLSLTAVLIIPLMFILMSIVAFIILTFAFGPAEAFRQVLEIPFLSWFPKILGISEIAVLIISALMCKFNR